MKPRFLTTLIRKFLKEQSGATALIFAVSLVPIVVATGAAIDYSRASKSRQFMQQVIDAAALAGAAPQNIAVNTRKQIVNEYIAANMPPGTDAPITSIVIEVDNEKITVEADGQSPTTFLQLAHIETVSLKAITQVMLAQPIAAEIVFILDYSGSMGGSKYKSMRDSVINTVNTLTSSATAPDIKFGLVPFSGQVYMPTLPMQYADGNNKWWMACTQDRPYPANRTDDTPNSGDSSTKWDFKYSSSTCKGYRDRKLEVRELTNDYSAVTAQLSAMLPLSMTHIALGMEIGWHVLSPNEPFTGGTYYNNPQIKKFAVLLTDGEQTEPAFGPANSEKASNGEKNLEVICEGMKAKGIVIATVAFDLHHASTKKRLENCATNTDHYFEPNTTTELSAAFQVITQKFAEQIHIAK